jgi:competence protein ComEC
MLLLAACFATGILCRQRWQPPVHMILVCCTLLSVACVARTRTPRLAWFSTGAFWIALGWTASVLHPNVQDTSLLRYADGLQRIAQVRVVSVHHLPPPPAQPEAPLDRRTDGPNSLQVRDTARQATQVLEVQVLAIEDVSPEISRMTTLRGGAILTLYRRERQAGLDVPCGARLRATVRLHAPQRYLDPGVWSYSEALRTRGIIAESSVDSATVHIEDRTHIPARCRFADAQRWSSMRLSRLAQNPLVMRTLPVARLTQNDAAMLAAMLFGDRTLLQRSVRTAFERTGSFHLFVVAGMHVALLMAGLFAFLQRVRFPRWIAAIMTIALTCAYAVLTGFGQPVQRALLMSSVYLLARLMGRQRNALNALGAAILAMLALRPDALTDAGFQMTVLAVVAIGGIALPLSERTVAPYARALRDIGNVRDDAHLKPRQAQMRVALRWLGHSLALRNLPRSRTAWIQRIPALLVRSVLMLCELLLITLTAEVVMALPMAMYFHRVTPFAAPANLLALPMVGVLMFGAIVTFLTSLLHPALAVLPAALTASALHAVTFIIATLNRLHGADVRTPSPSSLLVVLSILLWCGAAHLLHRPGPAGGRIAVGMVPLGLLLVLFPLAPHLHRDRLEFTAIDVGQGDSLLVVSPNAGVMLIDAGGPTGTAATADEDAFDVGEQVVSPYLWSRGVRRLDTLVLTHAHSDHIGGMLAVLRNFRPRELWLSVDADSPPLRALLKEATARNVTVRHLHGGDVIHWKGTEIQVLGPATQYKPRSMPTNDDSLVLRMQYGRSSVLTAGDAEHASEAQMLSQPLAPVTLLKVGHHGSNTSTSEDLLKVLHPAAAVISCGLGNRFGHPRTPVLQRLQAARVSTARTDDMGAVQYLLSADGSFETHVLASQP